MHLRNTSINGIETDVTFDTGAGVNIISDLLALKYNLMGTITLLAQKILIYLLSVLIFGSNTIVGTK